MIRVNNRMNIYTNDEWEADRMRAQMDYHMFLAHALAVNACHELVEGGKIAPAVSSTCTYPLTNKPEDVWAARMNDWFKTNYCLEMHTNGEYPGYYMRYLEERNIVPKMEPGDAAILKSAKDRLHRAELLPHSVRQLSARRCRASGRFPRVPRQRGGLRPIRLLP